MAPLLLKVLFAHCCAAAGFVVYQLVDGFLAIPAFIFCQLLVAAAWLSIGYARVRWKSHSRDVLKRSPRSIAFLALAYGVSLFLYFVFFYNAISSSSAANVSLLLSIQPALIILSLWILFTTPMRQVYLVGFGVFVSLLGVLIYKKIAAFEGGVTVRVDNFSEADAYVALAVLFGVVKALATEAIGHQAKTAFPVKLEKHHRDFVAESALVGGFWAAVVLSGITMIVCAVLWPIWLGGDVLTLIVVLGGILFIGVVPIGVVERIYQVAQNSGLSVLVFSSRQVIPMLVYGASLLATSLGAAIPIAMLDGTNLVGAALILCGVVITIFGKGSGGK